MTFLLALADFSSGYISSGYLFDSPFIIPVAGCLTGLGIVLGGIWSGVRHREMQSQERLAAIAAGVPLPPTVEELAMTRPGFGKTKRNDGRGARRAGIVLISTAVGLIAFFVALSAILHVREVLTGGAVGLIPMLMGFGFLIDARINAREAREAAEASGEASPLGIQ